MKVIICPIHWTYWRESFEPRMMVSLVDSPADLDGLRPHWVEEHYQDCFRDVESELDDHAPTRRQVENLTLWLRRRINEESRLLVHCHAGRGRSPAAGYVAWALLLGPGKEQEAFKRMTASCLETALAPNRLITAHADRILERGGALLHPLETWYRRFPHRRIF